MKPTLSVLAAALVAAFFSPAAFSQTAQSTAADGFIAACTNPGTFLTESPNPCADDPLDPGAHEASSFFRVTQK